MAGGLMDRSAFNGDVAGWETLSEFRLDEIEDRRGWGKILTEGRVGECDVV